MESLSGRAGKSSAQDTDGQQDIRTVAFHLFHRPRPGFGVVRWANAESSHQTATENAREEGVVQVMALPSPVCLVPASPAAAGPCDASLVRGEGRELPTVSFRAIGSGKDLSAGSDIGARRSYQVLILVSTSVERLWCFSALLQIADSHERCSTAFARCQVAKCSSWVSEAWSLRAVC